MRPRKRPSTKTVNLLMSYHFQITSASLIIACALLPSLVFAAPKQVPVNSTTITVPFIFRDLAFNSASVKSEGTESACMQAPPISATIHPYKYPHSKNELHSLITINTSKCRPGTKYDVIYNFYQRKNPKIGSITLSAIVHKKATKYCNTGQICLYGKSSNPAKITSAIPSTGMPLNTVPKNFFFSVDP